MPLEFITIKNLHSSSDSGDFFIQSPVKKSKEQILQADQSKEY